jgi:signal transduction histidine kinase
MRLSFKDVSIKFKIIMVILFTSAVALTLSGISLYNFDKKDYKKTTLNNLSSLAEVICYWSDMVVIFNDFTRADNILNSLKSNKNIVEAAMFMKDNEILAKYEREGHTYSNLNIDTLRHNSSFFNDTALIVYKPIYAEEDSSLVGSLYINSDLDAYYEKTQDLFVLISIIVLSALLIAFLISLRLQRIISKPILSLSGVMRRVSSNKDFSTRIDKEGNDEIGTLISGFNEMLEQIEQQNLALVLAKDQAESSAKVKEQFLANISHEIRTPMNAIVGMSNLLNQTLLNDDQEEYVKYIRKASDNLLVLINDILDFSKLEAGRIEFEKIEFDLFATINEVKQILHFKAKEKNLEINIDIDPDAPEFVIGDKFRLNQVMLNLVGNGIKFTDKGSISIEVRKIDDNDRYTNLLFSVIDTGIGISPDKIKTIFTSFSQASTDTTRKYGGTGLGLTISKQLVELQGGKMYVYSKVNEGSNFSFNLSFLKSNTTQVEIKKEAKEENQKKFEVLYGKKVLLVEDNKMNQVLARKVLMAKGMEVDIAENGKIAIEKLQKNSYRIILMDIHMPVMDGFDTTEHIRSNFTDHKKRIPIIAVTGAALENEKSKCFACGMNDYITKPFDQFELYGKIEKLIDYDGKI